VGILSPRAVALQPQRIDFAKKVSRRLANALQGDSAENFMIRRKIWLHYQSIRLSVEILTICGTAALIGYWIVQTAR
jgi:hypothetical protein